MRRTPGDSLFGVDYLANALRLYSLWPKYTDLLRLAYLDVANAHQRLQDSKIYRGVQIRAMLPSDSRRNAIIHELIVPGANESYEVLTGVLKHFRIAEKLGLRSPSWETAPFLIEPTAPTEPDVVLTDDCSKRGPRDFLANALRLRDESKTSVDLLRVAYIDAMQALECLNTGLVDEDGCCMEVARFEYSSRAKRRQEMVRGLAIPSTEELNVLLYDVATKIQEWA